MLISGYAFACDDVNPKLEEHHFNPRTVIEQSYISANTLYEEIVCEENKRAFKKLSSMARKGNRPAQINFLFLCFFGKMLPMRGDEEIMDSSLLSWLREESDNGNKYAQYDLGLCCEMGVGGIQLDEKLAFEYYSCSARQADRRALFKLARCYEFGKGVPSNPMLAFENYYLSAKRGEPRAQFRLGLYYEYGIEVPKTESLAFKYYFLSAKQREPRAQFRLGLCYQYGRGTLINESLAFENYWLSSKKGHQEAQIKLASCYENGLGTEENQVEAIFWYIKSNG